MKISIRKIKSVYNDLSVEYGCDLEVTDPEDLKLGEVVRDIARDIFDAGNDLEWQKTTIEAEESK